MIIFYSVLQLSGLCLRYESERTECRIEMQNGTALLETAPTLAYYKEVLRWHPFAIETIADLDTWNRICKKLKTQRMDNQTPNRGDYEFYLKSK